ncbi:uncharacterized protein LOC120681361 [Panicum virgatum]|uniref:uncharacterized protein LOC120681361 n=1 Tax=Panicum virgatum TaxID=38727 RepID=UPI0019D4FAAC|nr:uncharacterized protein LOC120681361 [Panicum virgatum]
MDGRDVVPDIGIREPTRVLAGGRTPRRHGGRPCAAIHLRPQVAPPVAAAVAKDPGSGSGLLYSARPSLAHLPISSPPPPTSSRPQTSSRPSPPPATGAGSGLLLAGSEVPSPDRIRWVRVVAAAACPGVTCLARPSAGDFRCGDLPHLSVLVALLGPAPPARRRAFCAPRAAEQSSLQSTPHGDGSCGGPCGPVVLTVVPRVVIPRHGCKNKVRKVLRSVEGVQSVMVEAAQLKVTVTGTMDVATLVQRLHKSGKNGIESMGALRHQIMEHRASTTSQPEFSAGNRRIADAAAQEQRPGLATAARCSKGRVLHRNSFSLAPYQRGSCSYDHKDKTEDISKLKQLHDMIFME